MLKLSAKLLHFFELYKFFVKNTTCTVQQQMQFVCKVSKNILKNKIKECQSSIFLLVSCLIYTVFF